MKPYFSVIIFILLSASSVITGADRYIDTKHKIESDLTNALNSTLADKGYLWVTADTIKAYRQLQNSTSGHVSMLINDKSFARNLSIPWLRDKAYISFDIINNGNKANLKDKSLASVNGDTIIISPQTIKNKDISVVFRSHAECSYATIFRMSDQRLPALLSLMAVLWAMMSFTYIRRKQTDLQQETSVPAYGNKSCMANKEKKPTYNEHTITVGNMSFDNKAEIFYSPDNTEIRLTPMQFDIMKMFFRSENHKLTKTEICNSLWPKKDNADETLYAMIRRLKPVIETNSNLKIEVERGKAYKLIIENKP